MCLDPVSSQFGLDRFENLAETKLLSYNLSKSGIVILGKKKARDKLIKEFKENPSKLNEETLKILNQESYLGDQLGTNTSESISLTINKRIGLTKKSIFEIKNIMEDCRSKVSGGIRSGLILWESCVIPFILNNCSTWINMKKKNLQRLDKLQNLFLFTLLNVQHCPIPLMYLDLGILSISFRILKEKLILFHHISCLPEEAISHKIMKIQKVLNFPGLFRDIEPFLIENEILDVCKFSKEEWKRLVQRKIKCADMASLIEQSKRYKMINSTSLSLEEFELKEYFINLDLARARLKFRERANCMNTCKRNYSSDYNHIRTMFNCESCKSNKVDVISHWRECSSYEQFRLNRNLGSDFGLMSYYQDIINFRKDEAEE